MDPDPDSGWDWEQLYYMGTVLLQMSEEVFWKSTPRKLFSLMDVHIKINNPDSSAPTKQNNQSTVKDIMSW